MGLNIVWFLDINWLIMALVAAGFAAMVNLIASIVAAVRIGRAGAMIFVVALPIYTFVSCLFYTIILAISVSYTYQYNKSEPENAIYYWGIGFGVLYILLKAVISGYLK